MVGFAGVFGSFIIVVNLVMTYKTIGGGVGIGIWLLALFAIGSVVAGEMGRRYS